jgi:AraC family transcriptional regulator
MTSRLPARSSGIHALAADTGFAARDCVCRYGVRSPVFGGQFRRAQISVILGGTFHARSSAGALLASPGALLLGNASGAYEFRHVDDGGDRSVIFDYAPVVLDEIARSLELRDAPQFRAAAIPASPAALDAVVLAERALCTGDREELREAALAVAMIALAAERDLTAKPPPLAQARRVARALRYIEAHSADDCSLEVLAAEARLSRCHFLRVFRAMTGQTPRQHVIATRLRAAATALRASRTPITRIALEAGFGDLSHFTQTFSLAFGTSPRRYRSRARHASSATTGPPPCRG